MSVDVQIFAALSPLAGGRVFPDVAPEGTARPYLTYQQVGGDALNFMEGTMPGKRNARIQINAWADTRLAASELSEQAEDALRLVLGLQAEVLGARVSIFEEDIKLRGARQDFSVWY